MKITVATACLIICLLFFCCQNEEDFSLKSAASSIASHIEYDTSQAHKKILFQIDTFFSKRHKQNQFNGVALFAKDGKILYHKAFGYADFSSKRLLDKNDAFQLASVSKTITAVATLQLIEDYQLSLEDTLQQYFPNFPYSNITIRQLLSHQSGLPNYMYFVDDVFTAKDSSISNDFMLTIMERDRPKPYFLPNTRYHYSNTNYALLANLIEKVSGQSFENFVKQHIFEPARMDSAFIYNKNKQPQIPQNVIGYNGIVREKENHYQNGIIGDKGVYASALDLFKFDLALSNGELVRPDLLKQAYFPYDERLNRLQRDNYGLGWRIQYLPDYGKVVYHGGWWKGFKSYYIRMLDKRQTIIVLTNVTKGGYLNKVELQKLMEE